MRTRISAHTPARKKNAPRIDRGAQKLWAEAEHQGVVNCPFAWRPSWREKFSATVMSVPKSTVNAM